MKLTLHIALAIFFVLGFYPESSKIEKDLTKTAVITFDNDIIDYGEIAQHSDGNRVFTFTNNGEVPLLIADVKTSCGCTVPSYTKSPILPGEKGELKIKYNTKRIGAFNKRITVISNAQGGNTYLKIKGNVVASK